MKRDFFNSLSSTVGAIYFPPEVLKISFLRSVIVKNPSESISPMSPE